MIRISIFAMFKEMVGIFESDPVRIGLTQLNIPPRKKIKKFPRRTPVIKMNRKKPSTIPDNFFYTPQFLNTNNSQNKTRKHSC